MKRTSSFAVFRRTMALIGAGADLPGMLDAIVRMVEAEDPTILCSILLLDETGRRIAPGAAPSLPDSYNNAIYGIEIGPDVGCCGTAMFTGQRVVVEDIATDPLWAAFKTLAQGAGLASCWSEPIRVADGAVVGSFAIYHRTCTAPTEEDIAFIEAAAELTSLAIERDRDRARARQATEREVEAARDLTTFFEISADLLCITDFQSQFVRVNDAWTRVLGWSRAELEGQSYLDFMHPDDREATLAEAQIFQHGHEILAFRNRYRTVTGEYRVLEWQARQSNGLVYAAARDVTAQVEVAREMEAAREAAELANQAKSDFLANMSHEIRTPLNGVIGVIDALARTELSGAQREMVDLIRESGVNLAALVSDILDLSRIEAGGLELEEAVFDLGEALGGALAMARLNATAKGLNFRSYMSPAAQGRFRGDGLRLRQVLGNLLSNAVKFTETGTIAVELDCAVTPEGGEALSCSVSDTGVGFDPTQADQLFQRFNQIDATMTRRFGGSGLGLAICRSLVERMGGEISAESRPGEGSVFRFTVPLRREAVGGEAPHATAEPAVAPGARPLHVLLAEDNLANQKVVELLLSPFDIVLETVENGAQALEALRRDAFDLVLMDLQMPVMDGLTATRSIRHWEAERSARRTPIVVLSANAMAHHCAEALAAGADLHVAKPLTGAALLAGIEQALDHRGAA